MGVAGLSARTEKKALVAFGGGPWGPAVAKAAGWAGSMGLGWLLRFESRGTQVEEAEEHVGWGQ